MLLPKDMISFPVNQLGSVVVKVGDISTVDGVGVACVGCFGSWSGGFSNSFPYIPVVVVVEVWGPVQRR